MCGVENHTILKHVCTRWLSLERALDRLLEQWVPLQLYFQTETGSVIKRKCEDSSAHTSSKKQKVSPAGSSAKKTSSVVSSASTSSVKKSTTSSGVLTSAKKTSSVVSSTSTCTSSAVGASRLYAGTKSHCSKERDSGVNAKSKISHKDSSKDVPTVQSRNKACEISAKFTENNRMYCIFLQNTIPIFNQLNLELQEEAPKIHLVHEKLHKFLGDVLVRFVKPSVIADASSLDKCDYKQPCNQKTNEDLILGQAVKDILSSEQLSSTEKEDFYNAVRKYYTAVCNYVIDTFPLNDELLLHARVASPSRRLETKFASVEYFAKRFHYRYMEHKLDELEVEFGHFQTDPLESISLEKRVDAVWMDISSIKEKTTGRVKYVYLPKIMVAVLSIPHSNAEDERLFSLVKKNATEFRPNLSTKTLSDILTQKVFTQVEKVCCHQATFPQNVLEKCKKATSNYNKSQ